MADPRYLRRSDVPEWPFRRYVRWRWFWWFPDRSDIRAAYLDVRAWSGGWCNHCPVTARNIGKEGFAVAGGGGYAHWRCELRRGHEGLHRLVNYVWTDDGRSDYVPPRRAVGHVRSPWADRHRSGSWRHRLRRARWNRDLHRRTLEAPDVAG